MIYRKEVLIDYTNWRGKRLTRLIRPNAIVFGNNEWHPEMQWLLEADDVEKGESRTFALTNIHSWRALHDEQENKDCK
jgi:predicted DNA-binding transcriptional regulator YafY